MKNSIALIVIALAMALSACSTTPVGMTYSLGSEAASSPKAPLISVGTITDSRKNDPKGLGAIRNGFGGQMKTLETEQPVSEVVKTTLIDGLTAHGLLAKNKPKYILNVNMMRFDCNQYARREAHILLDVFLVDATSQQTIFNKTVKSDKVTGSIITLDAGIFASVDDLRQVANDVLQDAIDQLLNDPAFLAKVH